MSASHRAHYHAHSYFSWIPVFRDYPMSPARKLTGLILATYADAKDGRHAHPGIAELMAATGYGSRTTVTEALEWLRAAGFVNRTYTARRGGRSHLADEYQLSLHDGLRKAAGHKPCDCEHP